MPDRRISRDEYFMEIATSVAKRSTCLRRKVGAVLVDQDHMIISTGYNGSPRRCGHCGIDHPCVRIGVASGEKLAYCYAVHAEQNAICAAAFRGHSTKNSTCYSTTFPCSICAKLLINAGITRIVYGEDYDDDFSKLLLKEAKTEIIQYIRKGE